MNKEHTQHFGASHHAEKLRVIAEFHEVVWGGRGRAREAERRGAERFDNGRARLAIKRFQDAAFVQNNASKVSRVELVQDLLSFLYLDHDVTHDLTHLYVDLSLLPLHHGIVFLCFQH